MLFGYVYLIQMAVLSMGLNGWLSIIDESAGGLIPCADNLLPHRMYRTTMTVRE